MFQVLVLSTVTISVGAAKISTPFQSVNSGGDIVWAKSLVLGGDDMVQPEDVSQIPDTFVYFQPQGNDDPTHFCRYKTSELLRERGYRRVYAEPTWIMLCKDKSATSDIQIQTVYACCCN